MLGTFLFILFLILGICEFIWYLTCTKHKDVPLILVLVDVLTLFCPILNIVMFFVNLWILYALVDEFTIDLKDNWFNRTFLAYNAE